MHENNLHQLLPTVCDVATTLATIPATVCSSERSFSGLRRMKTYMRSRMSQERLSCIAIINIEREYSKQVIEKDIEKIIDIFGRRCGRNKSFF